MQTLKLAPERSARPALPSGLRRPWQRGTVMAAWLVGMGLVAAGLSGCGGASTEDPPSVTLATSPTSAVAGATVTLIAVASDDQGVSEVRFYRVDSGTSVLLGTLNTTPYQMITTIPTTASGSVTYFARAVDTDNNTTDSAAAVVTITQ